MDPSRAPGMGGDRSQAPAGRSERRCPIELIHGLILHAHVHRTPQAWAAQLHLLGVGTLLQGEADKDQILEKKRQSFGNFKGWFDNYPAALSRGPDSRLVEHAMGFSVMT